VQIREYEVILIASKTRNNSVIEYLFNIYSIGRTKRSYRKEG
jgi:hypothetical protein